MSTRRAFLGQVAGLAAAGGAVWLAREHLLFPKPSVAFVDGADSSGWIGFSSRRRPQITIPITVNGTPVTALIDSGAQHSIVHRALADRLQLESAIAPPTVVFGAGGGGQPAGMATAEIGLGDIRLPRLRVALLDLGLIASDEAMGAPVILGHDVLRALVADIDFPRRRIRFHRPDALPLPEGAVAVAARTQGRAIAASILVEGRPVEVVVDTGASAALSLSSATAEELGLLDGRPLRFGQSLVLGGVVTGRVLKAESLELAGQKRGETQVYVFEPQRIPGFPKGLLGFEAMRRHRVILDGARGTMHLVP